MVFLSKCADSKFEKPDKSIDSYTNQELSAADSHYEIGFF